MTSPSR